jgi:chorismate dehydratase
MVQYTNTVPFTAAWDIGILPPPDQLVFGVPTDLNRGILAGELDVALMSAAAFLENREQLQLLRGPCIAAADGCESVLLFPKGEIQSIDGQDVLVTPESASSTRLLKVLCKHFWEVHPRFISQQAAVQDSTPCLVIGDHALRMRLELREPCIDLAQAWYYATGLPFTFAVLAARKDLDPHALAQVQESFMSSLNWARSHQDEVTRYAAEQRGFSSALIQHYFGALQYEADLAHCRGMQRFAELAQELKEEVIAV